MMNARKMNNTLLLGVIAISWLFIENALTAQAASKTVDGQEKIEGKNENAVAVLSIDVAVELALEGNVDVKKGQITLDALERAKNTSWNSISPSLTLSGGLSFPNPDTPQHDNYTVSERFSGSVDIKLTPSLYSSIKAAKIDYENGLITFREAVRSVELQVRKAFFYLLYEKQNIALQQRNTDTAKSRYEQNLVKYRNGRVSEVDMLTSQVNYKKLYPQLEEARVNYAADIASFMQLIGLDVATVIDIEGSLDEAMEIGEINATIDVEDTARVRQAKNAVDSAEVQLLAGRLNSYGPTVSAGWNIGRSKTNKDDDWTKTGELSLGVTIPLDGIMPWSQRAQTIEKAKDTVKACELNLEDERASTERAITSALNKAKTGRLTLESLKVNVDLAKTTYNMTLDSYNHGFVDYMAVQSASDALLDAEVRLQQQEYNLLSCLLDLEGILGVKFCTIGK